MIFRTTVLNSLGAALALLASTTVSAQVYYSNDFDSPEFVAPGVGATLTGGANDPTVAPYGATYGNIYRNDSNVTATELTLTGLPAHTGVDLNFVMAFLDSWDSYDDSTYGPDNLDLSIDGSLVATYTYNNALGTFKDYDGGTLLYEYVQFDGDFNYSDTVVDMAGDPALSFPHTGSSLTISFIASGSGWQGGTDEAYAIDNLNVVLSGVTVPEPASCVLLATSALGLAFCRRS